MSIMKELQNEIARLARKEIKKELEPIKRVNAQQRKLIANLRRDITDLQRALKLVNKEVGAPTVEEVKEQQPQRMWMTGKGVLSMRNKLGLSQAELAQLADVTTQSVVKWEKTEGKISFRQQETLIRLQEIRGMGRRKAWAQIGKEKS